MNAKFGRPQISPCGIGVGLAKSALMSTQHTAQTRNRGFAAAALDLGASVLGSRCLIAIAGVGRPESVLPSPVGVVSS